MILQSPPREFTVGRHGFSIYRRKNGRPARMCIGKFTENLNEKFPILSEMGCAPTPHFYLSRIF